MIRIFYFFALGILMLSCTDENIRIEKEGDNESSRSALYKVYSSEARNHLLIESFGGIYDTNSISKTSSRSLEGAPLSLTFNGKTITGPIKIEGKGGSWSISESADAKSLFGNQIVIKMGEKGLIASIDGITTPESRDELRVYIPEIIQAKVSGLDVDRNIVPGTTIIWNKDVNNRNGVSIMVEYSPYQQTNYQSYSGTKPDPERRFLDIEDTGSYTVTKEDLANYPQGTNLSFYIGRSAYAISPGGSTLSDTSIGAITVVRSDFRIAY